MMRWCERRGSHRKRTCCSLQREVRLCSGGRIVGRNQVSHIMRCRCNILVMGRDQYFGDVTIQSASGGRVALRYADLMFIVTMCIFCITASCKKREKKVSGIIVGL